MDLKTIDQVTPPLHILPGEAVLAVDCALLLGRKGPLPTPGIRHCHLAEVDAGLLRDAAPACVILPLFAAAYDALTAVELLEDLGYLGRIAVMAPDLPKPRLVEQELRQLGPGARLVLISP